VLLLKSYDEPVTPYTGEVSEDALTQFALSHAEPVLPEMDQCALTLTLPTWAALPTSWRARACRARRGSGMRLPARVPPRARQPGSRERALRLSAAAARRTVRNKRALQRIFGDQTRPKFLAVVPKARARGALRARGAFCS
jgi:hypothetical protein